ncbi:MULTISPECIES: regulator component [Streptomyces]|uniref:Regulator component n=1 Tax=Streptomyces hawaiiensis TaxID=67305 RepID=A0A5B9BH38_9ACTN|nr:regulator component [Streptomyces hawaiiensis]QCD59158.1 regulator component [Streptomyces hawaiiensis]QED88046.1 putative regulator component [Streptomyces hawaiiensis]
MMPTSEYLRLQRRCRKILDNLHAPQTNSFEAICQWVEERRGRPLILRELPDQIAATGVCGLWLGIDEADLVFYQAHTVPFHQQHIILHELGHILCDHHRAPNSVAADQLSGLFNGLQPQLIKRLMTRTRYTAIEEQEAEMIASLLHSTRRVARPSGTLGRIGAFLGVAADDSE